MAAEENELAKLVKKVIDDYVCPITYGRMKDPVVAADGYTYKRAAIAKWFVNHETSPMMGANFLETTALFPNRAFKGLISDLAMLKEVRDLIRFIDRIYAFECPLTRKRMKDPVIAADGFTYGRTAIAKWFVNNNTSPITGASLETTALFPNYAFKNSVSNLADCVKGIASVEAIRLSLAIEAEDKRKKLEADERFKRSDKPGVLYEANSYLEFTDAELLAHGIDPLCCIKEKVGFEYRINIYDSKETAEAVRLSLAAEAEAKRKLLEADKRFTKSDKPGVLYEANSYWEVTDEELLACGIDPLKCIKWKERFFDCYVYVYDSIETAEAVRLSLAAEAEAKRKLLEADKRFTKSDKPGVLYEANSYWEVTDEELLACGIDPLKCIKWKEGIFDCYVYVYDSIETAEIARLSLSAETDKRFKRSDEPGVLYKAHSYSEITDEELFAHGFDPLQCISWKEGIDYYVYVYDSKETAEVARLSLAAKEEEKTLILAANKYQFHAVLSESSNASLFSCAPSFFISENEIKSARTDFKPIDLPPDTNFSF